MMLFGLDFSAVAIGFGIPAVAIVTMIVVVEIIGAIGDKIAARRAAR
jgi:hypothetical protein